MYVKDTPPVLTSSPLKGFSMRKYHPAIGASPPIYLIIHNYIHLHIYIVYTSIYLHSIYIYIYIDMIYHIYIYIYREFQWGYAP